MCHCRACEGKAPHGKSLEQSLVLLLKEDLTYERGEERFLKVKKRADLLGVPEEFFESLPENLKGNEVFLR